MAGQYISELMCGVCASTGHVTWDGNGPDKRALDMSTHIRISPDNPALFTCLKCGTEQAQK
jgi:hypothetical protein